MSEHELHSFSRQKLYSLVNRQKREINCLKTDLLRFKLHSNCYQKYFEFLEKSNENDFDFNNYLLIRKEVKDLNLINSTLGSVSVNSIQNNYEINDCNQNNIELKEVFTQTENYENLNEFSVESNEGLNCIKRIESLDELNAEEVTDNEWKGFECDLNYMNDSNDETINANIGLNCDQNEDNFENRDNYYLTEIKTELIETNNQLIDKSFEELSENGLIIRSFSKSQLKSNRSETELSDSYIESRYDTKSDEELSYNCLENKIKKNGIEVYNINRSSDEKPLICRLNGCDEQFKDKHQLCNHHLRAHSELFEDIEWIECSENGCKFRTKLRQHFDQHLRVSHKKNVWKPIKLMFVCDFNGCLKEFKTNFDLTVHKLIHSEHTFSCEWDDCSARFDTPGVLRQHYLKHKGSHTCDYVDCGFKTTNKSVLELHKQMHSTDTPFRCDYCGKQFKYNRTLIAHKTAVHPDLCSNTEYLKCTEIGCEFQTKFTKYFCRHIQSHTFPFECEVCAKRFSWANQLSAHMSTHTGDQPYRCPHCPNRFGIKFELKIHLQTHDGKQFSCDFSDCSKSFENELNLKRHKARHKVYSNNKKSFDCEWYGCDRSFSTKSVMKDHMNTHTEQLSHPCVWPGCANTYTTKKSLSVHMTRHKGLGQYRCVWPECGYRSTNSIRFKNHMKIHSK